MTYDDDYRLTTPEVVSKGDVTLQSRYREWRDHPRYWRPCPGADAPRPDGFCRAETITGSRCRRRSRYGRDWCRRHDPRTRCHGSNPHGKRCRRESLSCTDPPLCREHLNAERAHHARLREIGEAQGWFDA